MIIYVFNRNKQLSEQHHYIIMSCIISLLLIQKLYRLDHYDRDELQSIKFTIPPKLYAFLAQR